MGNKKSRPKAAKKGTQQEVFNPKKWPHGCKHYRRKCKIIAPCCGMEAGCRLCHDERTEDDTGSPGAGAGAGAGAGGGVTGPHKLDRHAIKEMVCLLCNLRQPTAGECTRCHAQMGRYFCAKCNLFDDNITKGQFHCDDCGICRVGGRENMAHCDTCNVCVKRGAEHHCLAGGTRTDCSVCLEYMFDSRDPVTMLQCGHSMHTKCLRGLMKAHRYTCPLCSKSLVPDLSQFIAKLDAEVAHTPMPRAYRGHLRRISCNDCSAESIRPYHVVGHKCAGCGGYNTHVLQEILPSEAGAYPVDEYHPDPVG